MKRGALLETLPDDIFRAIGRVIFSHAVLENYLDGFAHAALEVSRKEGRIAIKSRGPLTERFDLITDLMKVHEATCAVEIKSLRNRIEDCSRQRDQLAHGIWVRIPDGRVMLRVVKGSWQPVEGQKVKRLISPEGIEFDEQDGLMLAGFINQTSHILIEMSNEVLPQISASRSKWRQELKRQNEEEGHSVMGVVSAPPMDLKK